MATIIGGIRNAAAVPTSGLIRAGARAVTPLPARAIARLTPVDNPAGVVELQMLGASTLDPGNPKWTEVSRPRRSSVMRLDGWNPTRQSFQVMFSGTPSADGQDLTDITPQVSALHWLIGGAGDVRKPPPVLRLAGPLYGIGPNDFWQVETITPSEPWRRVSDQRTAQVIYDVALVQWFPTDLVTTTQLPPSPAAASTARAAAASTSAAPPSARTYTVRKGDSLSAIAARELGNAGRWREIATLSGIRDPNRIYPGQVLKLP